MRQKDLTEEDIFDLVLENKQFSKEKKVSQNKRSCTDKAGRCQAAGPSGTTNASPPQTNG